MTRSTPRRDDQRVLAIDPTSRGFGYAVLEGAALLVDWGIVETTRADNQWVVAHVTERVRRYSPDVLILEDTRVVGARRRSRIRSLLCELENSSGQGLDVALVARRDVLGLFARASATNKEQIADTILQHFPELVPWRPPIRKVWMSEDARMAIFDAVAFALTYFYSTDSEKSETE